MSCKKNITRGCCFSKTEEGEATAQACGGCYKLDAWDWLADLPDPLANNEIFEVRFKNTRKGYYQNSNNIPLKTGDIVAVEASPGHDIGIVSLTGELVTRQMKHTGFSARGAEFKKIFRKAKAYDIEKWEESIALEHTTMIRSRQIASDLGLDMKIGDVEYQGDRLKAIFYYIAEQRVDFRELIKVLADQFRIRIEMRQIGARQEAGRIGGISACGRELCCSTWHNNFSTVTIGAARQQEISLNPQKLAGQCGKLKCCLNYELDTYIDARRSFPHVNAPLEAVDGTYHLVKSDILAGIIWFSPDPHSTAIMIPLPIDRVRKIISMNRKGIKVDRLEDQTVAKVEFMEPELKNVVGEESITRFDKSRSANGNTNGNTNKNNRNRNRNRVKGNPVNPNEQSETQQPLGETQQNASSSEQSTSENRRNNGNRNRSANGEGQPRNNNNRRTQNRTENLSSEARPQGEERPPREDRQPREGRPPREDRQPRENRPPREDRQPRENRPQGEERPPRQTQTPGDSTEASSPNNSERRGNQNQNRNRNNNNNRRGRQQNGRSTENKNEGSSDGGSQPA